MIILETFQTISSDFKFNTLLENKRVTMRFIYNIRNACFHMTFTDINDVTLYGIKVVPNFPLLRQRKSFIDFDGDIFVLPATDIQSESITYENFGNDFKLVYLNAVELEEWNQENGVE